VGRMVDRYQRAGSGGEQRELRRLNEGLQTVAGRAADGRISGHDARTATGGFDRQPAGRKPLRGTFGEWRSRLPIAAHCQPTRGGVDVSSEGAVPGPPASMKKRPTIVDLDYDAPLMRLARHVLDRSTHGSRSHLCTEPGARFLRSP
jgi:hypothetical protein